jgi:hypothetical protein
MITSYLLKIPAGVDRDSHNGLNRSLLHRMRQDRVPYVQSLRVICPPAVTEWRLDACLNGGLTPGQWFTIATSDQSLLVLPAAELTLSEWQFQSPGLGVPLVESDAACGQGWIDGTLLRWIALPVAGTLYQVSIHLNLVQYENVNT